MKSLSLSRPLIIMVVGNPGAGKSFFARQFAETFNAPLVSCDHLRSAMFENPTFSRAEESIIQTISDYEIDQLLKTGKTFLVDGCVNNRVDRAAIEKLARQHDYRTLVVWVQTDEPTSRARATKRSDKRRGDEFNAPISNELFDTQVKRFSAPLKSETQVVISGKHTYATQAKVILKKLVSPREDEIHVPHAPERTQNNNDKTPPARQRSITVN